jgi:hypothetical protein
LYFRRSLWVFKVTFQRRKCCRALTTIGIANKKAVGLKEILLAKYFTPVLPHEEVTCTVSGIGDEGSESIYKAVVTKGAVKVAEMKLLVSLKAGKRKQRNI